MFVEAELPVELSFEAASRALDSAMSDGGLVSESRRAVADGLEFVMPVGPRGGRFPAMDVIVQMLPARRADEHVVVPLRWETAGPAGRLFPALDANLELTASEDPGVSRLSIIGRYEPPLAGLGMSLDRILMSKVAGATMTAMLREVASQLQSWAH